jgi:hypothetical protein
VIYDRAYKEKKSTSDKHDTKKMVDDPDHMAVLTISKGKDFPPDLNINYGFALGKTQPVVIAKKVVMPATDDHVNTGGQIIVIVLADEDDIFKRASGVETPKAPVDSKTPAADNKPAAEPKAPDKADAPEIKPAPVEKK